MAASVNPGSLSPGGGHIGYLVPAPEPQLLKPAARSGKSASGVVPK